ncbi:MAG: DnaJ domain-containing protein [Deltaproteobacteria bacterium]|nr:DnaJ domain-containing protein [Deltaproteobacteria bacterium]MBW1953255.1 DnaJ domain-containing protein [Deltaproteobacteria bacterium]MBW1987459.1 DnaJ domain-containing protein [Deltaproteobacteria bacterium]MBW2135585.1 DnaJ domain-containing protein [Deltaproteobacteria bacterium]
MNLEKARQLLGLGIRATRREIQAAYRRAARRWHPDAASPDNLAEHHARMQEINEAYHCILRFLEKYRYHLEEASATQDNYQTWWHEHFGQDVLWETAKSRRPRRKSSKRRQS